MTNKATPGVQRSAMRAQPCDMQGVHNQDTEHVHVIEDVAGTSSAQSQAQNLYYPELPPNAVVYGEYAKGYGQYIYCGRCSAWVG